MEKYFQLKHISEKNKSKAVELALHLMHCSNYNIKLALNIVKNYSLKQLRYSIRNYHIKTANSENSTVVNKGIQISEKYIESNGAERIIVEEVRKGDENLQEGKSNKRIKCVERQYLTDKNIIRNGSLLGAKRKNIVRPIRLYIPTRSFSQGTIPIPMELMEGKLL